MTRSDFDIANKTSDRSKLAGRSLAFRSRITNGTALLEEVDGRSSWARRYRDLLHQYHSDLGGEEALSEGQRAMAKSAACIQVELEHQADRLGLLREEGRAPASHRLETFQRMSNTLRRLVRDLGLHEGRKA